MSSLVAEIVARLALQPAACDAVKRHACNAYPASVAANSPQRRLDAATVEVWAQRLFDLFVERHFCSWNPSRRTIDAARVMLLAFFKDRTELSSRLLAVAVGEQQGDGGLVPTHTRPGLPLTALIGGAACVQYAAIRGGGSEMAQGQLHYSERLAAAAAAEAAQLSNVAVLATDGTLWAPPGALEGGGDDSSLVLPGALEGGVHFFFTGAGPGVWLLRVVSLGGERYQVPCSLSADAHGYRLTPTTSAGGDCLSQAIAGLAVTVRHEQAGAGSGGSGGSDGATRVLIVQAQQAAAAAQQAARQQQAAWQPVPGATADSSALRCSSVERIVSGNGSYLRLSGLYSNPSEAEGRCVRVYRLHGALAPEPVGQPLGKVASGSCSGCGATHRALRGAAEVLAVPLGWLLSLPPVEREALLGEYANGATPASVARLVEVAPALLAQDRPEQGLAAWAPQGVLQLALLPAGAAAGAAGGAAAAEQAAQQAAGGAASVAWQQPASVARLVEVAPALLAQDRPEQGLAAWAPQGTLQLVLLEAGVAAGGAGDAAAAAAGSKPLAPALQAQRPSGRARQERKDAAKAALPPRAKSKRKRKPKARAVRAAAPPAALQMPGAVGAPLPFDPVSVFGGASAVGAPLPFDPVSVFGGAGGEAVGSGAATTAVLCSSAPALGQQQLAAAGGQKRKVDWDVQQSQEQ